MPIRRRRLIFVLSTVIVLLAAVPCLFVYELGGFRQNQAEAAFRPIGDDLEASGARSQVNAPSTPTREA